ncbi:ABC transporter permease [Salmonella enterica subsp. enterica]|nr:ABC transporter permease [Salmonella enterica subsp. enterica serovar Enteritidis]
MRLLALAGWGVVFFLLAPLVVVIAVSFTASNFLRFPPEGLSLKWYDAVISNPLYVEAFWLSIQIASLGTLIALVIGVPACLILVRKKFPGAQAISALFLSPLILPTVVLGVAILQYASALGFARTFWALLVGHIVLIIPYVMRATLVSLSEFDVASEEAAQDLGATTPQTLWLVTLPQIKPGVIAGGLLGFIISWINVEVSIFNSTSTLITLPVRIFNQVQATVDPSMAAVSAVTIYFAVLCVLLIDYFVGLERAGMK